MDNKIKEFLYNKKEGVYWRLKFFGRDRIVNMFPELNSYNNGVKDYLINIIRSRGFNSYYRYYIELKTNKEEYLWFKQNLTMKGTHFFRGDEWTDFIDLALSTFKGKDQVKIWCAGCSSGEEVYSLIMALLDFVHLSAINILATDYNDELLEKCLTASYANIHRDEIPERYRHYLISVKNRFTFNDDFKSVITTKNINLLSDEYPKYFDIILCRNVIKFFTPDKRSNVQRNLMMSVASGGFLFLADDDCINNKTIFNDANELGLKSIHEHGIFQKNQGTSKNL